jgi:hypothetical protein
MIGFLLPYMIRLGVPTKLQKAAAWLAAIIIAAIVIALLVAAFWRWVGHREDQAVTLNRAEVNAEAGRNIANAYQAADANMQARAEVDATNDKEVTHEASKGDASAVGPGTAAVLAKLRQQQAAGRR